MSLLIETDDLTASVQTRPFDAVSEAEYDLIASQWDEIMEAFYRNLNAEE